MSYSALSVRIIARSRSPVGAAGACPCVRRRVRGVPNPVRGLGRGFHGHADESRFRQRAARRHRDDRRDDHQHVGGRADAEFRRRRALRFDQLRWLPELRRRCAARRRILQIHLHVHAEDARRAFLGHDDWYQRRRLLDHDVGDGISAFSVAPTNLAFGSVPIGATGTLAVTITNTSGVAQTPNFAGGAPFDSTNFGGSQNCAGVALPAGGSCKFTYTFTPKTLGCAFLGHDDRHQRR